MARRDDNLQTRLDRDLVELKLFEILRSYREVLDEAFAKRDFDVGAVGPTFWHGASCS